MVQPDLSTVITSTFCRKRGIFITTQPGTDSAGPDDMVLLPLNYP